MILKIRQNQFFAIVWVNSRESRKVTGFRVYLSLSLAVLQMNLKAGCTQQSNPTRARQNAGFIFTCFVKTNNIRIFTVHRINKKLKLWPQKFTIFV